MWAVQKAQQGHQGALSHRLLNRVVSKGFKVYGDAGKPLDWSPTGILLLHINCNDGVWSRRVDAVLFQKREFTIIRNSD